MLTDGIKFKNFKLKIKNYKVNKKFSELLNEKNYILDSLKKNYTSSYSKQTLNKFKNALQFKIIGMGGSTLGSQTIYEFLKQKIKKKFLFVDNLQSYKKTNSKEKYTNLIISKSGNTLETIVNANIIIKNKDKNIFITENKKNYLYLLAEKLKSDVIHHNNFIGGRYSVLSEVGMLPAELMGLNATKFRQLNNLVKNDKFIKALTFNVSSTIHFVKKNKFNSIILNYDEKSDNLFKWYQQLIAESLGKKKGGLLPVVSTMPKDNHSVMQLYLDGFKNNFFTFFYTHETKSQKIKNRNILASKKFLKNKDLSQVVYAQKKATENVFLKKKIPFRSFEIKERDEKTLGELFCFFILETILIGKCLNINPYDQPAVELIKQETHNLLR